MKTLPIKYNPTRAWAKHKKDLKVIFYAKGIIRCELNFEGCWRNNALSFAHKHKRIWYLPKGNRKLLGAFEEVLLACIPCHQKIEGDRDLTLEVFKRLRP